MKVREDVNPLVSMLLAGWSPLGGKVLCHICVTDMLLVHDDTAAWKSFQIYWPFVCVCVCGGGGGGGGGVYQ